MWISFTILFTAAVTGLERIEGYKVTTTEYLGLLNMGTRFILLPLIASFLMYPVTLFPFSWLVRKFVKHIIARSLIYCFVGCMAGMSVFHELYHDDFVQRYQLNLSSSIVLFGIAGLLYAYVENYVYLRWHQGLMLRKE